MGKFHNLSARRRRNLKKAISERDGMGCFYCGKPMVFCEQGEQPDLSKRRVATLEHLRQRALGGTNRVGNLVLACRPCQRERHDH